MEKTQNKRKEFNSHLEYVLTVIGGAIGLGNVWRFPFLVYRNGGALFLIPFFIMLFVIGIPMFFLETSIGQFSGLSPTHAFNAMCPLFQGVGYAAIIINSIVGIYYILLISYFLYYFIFSIRAQLPWSDCRDDFKNCFICSYNKTINCTVQKELFLMNHDEARTPSEVYFYDKVLNLTESIDQVGDLQWRLVLCFLASWIIVFLAVINGVKSMGKISYVTALLPYLIILVLIIKGALLEGSEIGMDYYILNIDWQKLNDPLIWKDAANQVFYSLGCCTGILVSMSSFVGFKNNLIRDAFLIPIVDTLTGLFAGFAIFTVLGHMYLEKGATEFTDVAKEGRELVFIVYPEGISLMGEIAPLFSVFFFLTMLLLGFGSQFPIMEATITTLLDFIKDNYKDTKLKNFMIRLSICVIYFLLGLILTSQSGLHILDLLDIFVNDYPLIIVGLFQLIVAGWIYGTENLIRDIELMRGKKHRLFWMIWILCWRFISPIALLAILIASIIGQTGYDFPDHAVAIGWIIAAIPMSAIPICAIYQTVKYRNNFRALIKPTSEYYSKALKNFPTFLDEDDKIVKLTGFKKFINAFRCQEKELFHNEVANTFDQNENIKLEKF